MYEALNKSDVPKKAKVHAENYQNVNKTAFEMINLCDASELNLDINQNTNNSNSNLPPNFQLVPFDDEDDDFLMESTKTKILMYQKQQKHKLLQITPP